MCKYYNMNHSGMICSNEIAHLQPELQIPVFWKDEANDEVKLIKASGGQ